MNKDILNNDDAFLEWANCLNDVPEPPEQFEKIFEKKKKKIMKIVRAGKRPKFSYLSLRNMAFAGGVLVLFITLLYSANMESGKNRKSMSENTEMPAEWVSDSKKGIVEEIFPMKKKINSNIVTAASFDEEKNFKTVTDITVPQDGMIQYFSSEYQNIVIFTKPNAEGWKLKRGDTLTLKLMAYSGDTWADKVMESIAFGYVLDNKYYETDTEKINEYTYLLTAEEDGVYYPAVENNTFTCTTILKGEIE